MEKLCKGFVPKNTQKSTNWVVKVFEQWQVERNGAVSGDNRLCPSSLFEFPVLSDLNYWLLRFAIEARRAYGNPYPASSISNLLAGLYRHCKEHDANCLNFMNRKDPVFQDLNGALQVRHQSLHKLGVGAVVKHA